MSLEKTVEFWETGETLEYQIKHFLSAIRSDKLFSHYLGVGVPADFLTEARNYAKVYDSSLYQKLQQIPIRETREKKTSI